jgi:hypothetical protein
MKKDLGGKIAVVLLLIIFIVIFISLPGQSIFNFKSFLLRTQLNLKGGIELLLAPDLRLSGPVLLKLGETMTTKIKQNQHATPQVELMGTEEHGRYDGLVNSSEVSIRGC